MQEFMEINERLTELHTQKQKLARHVRDKEEEVDLVMQKVESLRQELRRTERAKKEVSSQAKSPVSMRQRQKLLFTVKYYVLHSLTSEKGCFFSLVILFNVNFKIRVIFLLQGKCPWGTRIIGKAIIMVNLLFSFYVKAGSSYRSYSC